MFGIRAFLFGLTAGTGLGYFAMNYHVVYGPDGPVVVSRIQQPPIRSAYVDVRNWSAAMWQRYPDVTAALVKAGKGDLIASGVARNANAPELPAAASWSDQAAGLRTQAEQGVNSLLESLPPIKFEDEPTPTPSSTIPSQTSRSGGPSSDIRATSGPSAQSTIPVQIGQATDPARISESQGTANRPAADLGPLTSSIPEAERVREIATKVETSYQQMTTILGEPAAIPGSRSPTSTVPATAQQRSVPQPTGADGSPADVLKSLFGGPGSSQQGAAPRIDRAIKTPAF